MRTSPKLVLGLALAASALPALGQDRPESILPPGFGQNAPTPSATPAPRPSAVPATAAPSRATAQPLPQSGVTAPRPLPTPTGTPTPAQLDPTTRAYYELPPFARRGTTRLGPVTSSGFNPDAFGVSADGPYLETLMRRLSAPLPSRWLSIALRRLLLTDLDQPRGVGGADFAAERAWLLLRMGESVGARSVVQSVDTADFTPKLYQVALNAMLAAGDPAGMCPLADGGVAATGERGWVVAQALCAAMRGDANAARDRMNAVRRRGVAGGIDLLLAQKVVGATASGGAVTIEWTGVDRLTAWRYGLAAATGTTIPDPLLASVGPQVRYWQALAPATPAPARVKAAEAAAAQGVLSSAALVDLYSSLLDDEDADGAIRTAALDLQTAYADRNSDTRVSALRRLWGESGATPYARLVLTARAAGRLPVRADQRDLDRIVASMLTAGLDRTAMRWRSVAPAGSDAAAMLTLANPDARTVAYDELSGYAGSGDAARKQRLLFAGMAGLALLSPADIERGAQSLDVRIGAANSWTRAIDRAAADEQPGTVLLLAAIGMQCADWRGVPPAALYRIVGALKAVGLTGEARMIAAEAIARS